MELLYGAALGGLSARQRHILATVGTTDTLGDAAALLGMAPAALSGRLRAITSRLGLVSVSELTGHARRRHTLEASSEAICGVDSSGRCMFASRPLAEMLGYSPAEIIGQDMHALVHPSSPVGDTADVERCVIQEAMVARRTLRAAHEVVVDRHGSPVRVSVDVEPIVTEGALGGAIVTLRDLTALDRLSFQADLAAAHLHLALDASDSLAFEIDLASGDARSSISGTQSHFTHADLERLVHPLQRHKVALGALRVLPPGQLIEDDLLMAGPEGSTRWYRARFRVLTDQRGVPSSVIGVARYLAAVPAGHFIDVPELREAVARHQIVAYFQPIVRLADGVPVGVEALARWIQTDGTLIPPEEFIPVAEAANLMPDITALILSQACQQVATWNSVRLKNGLDPLTVSVNVPAADLGEDGFAGRLIGALEAAGLDHSCFVLEVTETTPFCDWQSCQPNIDQLHTAGVRIAIDDFGAGYSALERLFRLPATALKLDRQFAAGLPSCPKALAIASSVASLAQRLGLSAVAEGVERPAQAQALQQLGWQLGQGHLWSPARPAAELEPLMLAQQRL